MQQSDNIEFISQIFKVAVDNYVESASESIRSISFVKYYTNIKKQDLIIWYFECMKIVSKPKYYMYNTENRFSTNIIHNLFSIIWIDSQFIYCIVLHMYLNTKNVKLKTLY